MEKQNIYQYVAKQKTNKDCYVVEAWHMGEVCIVRVCLGEGSSTCCGMVGEAQNEWHRHEMSRRQDLFRNHSQTKLVKIEGHEKKSVWTNNKNNPIYTLISSACAQQ